MEEALRHLERGEEALSTLPPHQRNQNLMPYAQACALLAIGALLLRVYERLESLEALMEGAP